MFIVYVCVQCVCVLCMCLCNVFVCVCNVDMYVYACVCMCTFRQTIELFPEVLSVTADFKPVRFMDRIPIQEYMEYNIEFLLSRITQNSYNGIIACCLKKGIQHSGGGVTPIHWLYGYVPLGRVWFSSHLLWDRVK